MTRSTFLKTLTLAAAGSMLPGGPALAGPAAQPQASPAELELLAAVRSGDTQRAEALLAQEPGLIDRTLPGGGTALHAAARAGQGAMVSFLVGKGADSNALSTDPAGFTPLRWVGPALTP